MHGTPSIGGCHHKNVLIILIHSVGPFDWVNYCKYASRHWRVTTSCVMNVLWHMKLIFFVTHIRPEINCSFLSHLSRVAELHTSRCWVRWNGTKHPPGEYTTEMEWDIIGARTKSTTMSSPPYRHKTKTMYTIPRTCCAGTDHNNDWREPWLKRSNFAVISQHESSLCYCTTRISMPKLRLTVRRELEPKVLRFSYTYTSTTNSTYKINCGGWAFESGDKRDRIVEVMFKNFQQIVSFIRMLKVCIIKTKL